MPAFLTPSRPPRPQNPRDRPTAACTTRRGPRSAARQRRFGCTTTTTTDSPPPLFLPSSPRVPFSLIVWYTSPCVLKWIENEHETKRDTHRERERERGEPREGSRDTQRPETARQTKCIYVYDPPASPTPSLVDDQTSAPAVFYLRMITTYLVYLEITTRNLFLFTPQDRLVFLPTHLFTLHCSVLILHVERQTS